MPGLDVGGINVGEYKIRNGGMYTVESYRD